MHHCSVKVCEVPRLLHVDPVGMRHSLPNQWEVLATIESFGLRTHPAAMAVPLLCPDSQLHFLFTVLEVLLPILFPFQSTALNTHHPCLERVLIAVHAEGFSRLCRVDAEAS